MKITTIGGGPGALATAGPEGTLMRATSTNEVRATVGENGFNLPPQYVT
jgi:hypothetical protein